MSRLLLLALILSGSFAVYLTRGLPQATRAERAWSNLRQRERDLEEARRAVGPVDSGEFAALTARHERAQVEREQCWAALTATAGQGPPAPALATLLEQTSLSGLRHPSTLAERLLQDSSANPTAAAALVAVLQALPQTEGLEIEELALREAGRPRPLAENPGLLEVEAQLVLTGALSDALTVLERLAPQRGSGLPILSVRSASLRRIEPERWGSGVRRLSTPPVRLSATLVVLFATEGGGA